MSRRPFEGVLNIVRFNWPMYASSVAVIVIFSVAATLCRPPVSLLFGLGVVGALYLTLGSLLASYFVYDYSGFYRWAWLPTLEPRTVANIHSGFDESSLALGRRYPGASLTILDFYDPLRHTEPSIARARRYLPPPAQTRACQTTSLPLDDASQDVVFLIFAAHEIREHRERVRFFQEVNRIARGPIVVVEHLRDLNNFLAFGPGFVHFHSPAEWLSTWREAGLAVVKERYFTPFVRIYELVRS